MTTLRDVLTYADAGLAEQAAMDAGCHYDYVLQAWFDGCDHAHIRTDNTLAFCGADLPTCRGQLTEVVA